MRVLLTNDDGIFAEGLQALISAIEHIKGTEIYVVAPDRERSASGHAITIDRPIHVEQIQLPSSRAPAWSVSGTPADCVKLGIETLIGHRPDLVISGINRGANLGTDVFYSGTVSGAIEASFLGVKAMAISLGTYQNPDFSLAAAFATFVAVRLLEHDIPPKTLLNINVPPTDGRHLAGVVMTKLGNRQYRNVFDRRTDPRGRDYYWLGGEVVELTNDPDTDVVAVKRNQISITPIQLDLTNHDLIGEIKNWGLIDWSDSDS